MRLRFRSQVRSEDRGAALVELALILPILVTLLVGITQFGMAYSARVSIQGAAREGARVLALRQPQNVAAAVAEFGGLANDVVIVTDPCPATVPPGAVKWATVTVNASFTFSIPFVDLGKKPMSATAKMRCGL